MSTQQPTFAPIFEFATAARIIFGGGSLQQIKGIISQYNSSKIFIVTGKNAERCKPLTEILEKIPNVSFTSFSVEDEPTVETARQGLKAGKEYGADVIFVYLIFQSL